MVVCHRRKLFVVEVEWEASVNVDHFTFVFIRVGREGDLWTHLSLARTIRSIRSSSFCRSTTYVSGVKELEHTHSLEFQVGNKLQCSRLRLCGSWDKMCALVHSFLELN